MDTLESISEVPGKFLNAVLEKSDWTDREREMQKCYKESRRREMSYKQQKKEV